MDKDEMEGLPGRKKNLWKGIEVQENRLCLDNCPLFGISGDPSVHVGEVGTGLGWRGRKVPSM